MNSQRFAIGEKPIDIYFKIDRFIHEVLENEEYAPAFKDLVVIDLGCNIGAFTFSIYDKLKMCYALDISQECIDIMNQTITANKLDKVKTFCMGISGTGGERQFYTDDEPGLGGWKIAQDQRTPFPTKRLDEFMDENDIKVVDLMKIDIEGMEFELFLSDGFKKVASRIHKIVGEFHGGNPVDCLKAAGYVCDFYHTKGDNGNHSHFIAKKI